MIRSEKDLEYIKTVGADIIDSPIFRSSLNQKHHFRTTVGSHMLNTAYYSYHICKALDRFGIRTRHNDMIEACLCHDLGIVDNRYNKYKTGPECCSQHPKDSVDIAKDLLGDLDEHKENIIAAHMFPLNYELPRSREAVILTLTDKYCAILEVTGLLKPQDVMQDHDPTF